MGTRSSAPSLRIAIPSAARCLLAAACLSGLLAAPQLAHAQTHGRDTTTVRTATVRTTAVRTTTARATPTSVLRAMEISSIRVQHILDSARGVGDATRTSCVDARLSELHGAMRLATERVVRLQRASAAGERERAEREEALVLRLGERARIIEREARACVDPEPAMESGRVQLVVTIDANVPRDALRDHRGPATRPADAFTR